MEYGKYSNHNSAGLFWERTTTQKGRIIMKKVLGNFHNPPPLHFSSTIDGTAMVINLYVYMCIVCNSVSIYSAKNAQGNKQTNLPK